MSLVSPPAAVETSSTAPNDKNSTPVRVNSRFKVALAAIFLLSLSYRVYFNFFTVHNNCALVGDASEYLREAAALATPLFRTGEFLQNVLAVLTGSASPEVVHLLHQQTSVLNEFKVAGPVFPLVLLSTFAAAGKSVSAQFWYIPVSAQCVLSSITSVLVAIISSKAWNKKIAIVSGALFALYPSGVIATGALYNETFTVFLSMCIALITVSSIVSKPASDLECGVLGVVSAALHLTRPPSAILSVLTFPFVIWQRYKKSLLTGLLSLVIGFCTILLPYLVFQKVVFNSASLIVNRRASENLFMGNNLDTQGWSSIPVVGMPPAEKISAFVIDQWLKSPRQSVHLLIDKFIRLTKFPYNDRRQSIGAFVFPEQVLFHQFILIFAAIGLVLTLFTEPKGTHESQAMRNKCQARLALLTIAASNIVYIAFEAMARYFYPSMPILIMFAAAGFLTLIANMRLKSPQLAATCAAAICTLLISAQLNFAVLLLQTGVISNILLAQSIDAVLKLAPLLSIAAILAILVRDTTTGAQRSAQFLLAVLLIVTIATVCLPSRANGRSLETITFLSHPGQTIRQEIAVPEDTENQLRSKDAYLLIDAKGWRSLSGISVKINGQALAPNFIPGLSMVEEFAHSGRPAGGGFVWEYENLMQCMTAPSRLANIDLRQWFLLPIPASSFSHSHTTKPLVVEIEKTNYSTSVLYGEFVPNREELLIPSPSSQSVEKAFCSVESPVTFGDPRFDLKLRVARVTGSKDLHKLPGTATQTEAVPNIRLLFTANRPLAGSAGEGGGGSAGGAIIAAGALGQSPDSNKPVKVTTITIPDQQIERSQNKIVVVPLNFPTMAQGSIALLHFHGQIKALRGNPLPHIDVQLFAKRNGAVTGYSSPWTPSVIKSENSWSPFSFILPIAVNELPGKVEALQITTSDGDPHWQLLLAPESRSVIGIKDTEIEISVIPQRPVAPGYSLY